MEIPFADAIASIESSGRYDLLGPVTKSGDRAYGKYQVMGSNVPQWTKQYYGQPLTPDEYLRNKDAQDAVFKGQFGSYVSKYGPEGAARAWFAGEGGMNDPNRKDILGTTVAQYADKFNRASGNTPMPSGMPAIMGGSGQQDAGLPPILSGQAQGGGGLLSLFNDPENFAALAMIAKGINPWSQLQPQQMLAQAMAMKQQQGNQAYDRQKDQRDFQFRQQESQRAQQNTDRNYTLAAQTPAAKYALDKGLRPEDAGWRDAIQEYYDLQKMPTGFKKGAEGGLEPVKGGPADPAYLREKGDRQNAPSGYAWNNPSKPEEGMHAIPGGPGEKVDAEVAGRLGLAKSFLGQLPDIRKRVAAGELTGAIDAGKAYFGIGGPGEIRRQIDSGAEALLRMLTGAGMNKEEAAQYTRRYQFSPTDTAQTMLSKLDQLERELNSVGETVGKGRGGWNPSNEQKPAPTSSGKTSSGVSWKVVE